MDIKKVEKALKQLYAYGETENIGELAFLQQNQLIEVIGHKAVITPNWIDYGKQFKFEQDHLHSLFCFDREYQQYLIQVALLTVLKIRDAQDTNGLIEFVSKVPKLAEYVVALLKEIRSDNKTYNNIILEERIKRMEATFLETNHFIFDGTPQYQRIIYYLEHVQFYQMKEAMRTELLGNTIDQNWIKGRKISLEFQLSLIKDYPISTLISCEPLRAFSNPFFNNLFSYPWKLFVFLWCVVREHYEAQGTPVIRFRFVDGHIDVLIMSNKNQEFRYGGFNEFALAFCYINQFQLFPNVQLNLEGIFNEFFDRKVLTIDDEEYRMSSHVEHEIYNTDIFIPLIAKSKLLRQRMQQWIDELRDKA
ncbi:hypothetical protein GCM10008018_45220 [Paenibacillus marchantiophytorum]|uniref:DUF2357 domain-containing protein n=1 Tax=Paenibacillus marchantiophytorum TaxID=1619310 RepID=A0ABQ1EZL5_9BACL|nr:hypothetical protein GCM10008018_45220 [Paenibacillus marchantiophytorum]